METAGSVVSALGVLVVGGLAVVVACLGVVVGSLLVEPGGGDGFVVPALAAVVSPVTVGVVVGVVAITVAAEGVLARAVLELGLPVHAHRVGRSPPTWPSLASDTGALPVLRFSRHRLSPASSTTHTSHAGVDVHRAAHASHPPAAGDLAMVLPR